MNWRKDAGKICRGICYLGICFYFMLVGTYIHAVTGSAFLMGAAIFIINLLFWQAMGYIQNKTDKLKEERIEAETEAMRKQNIADQRAWNHVSLVIYMILVSNMSEKPINTFETLSFKMGYRDLLKAIARGERVWRI
ncbi:hypothetical protein GARY_170 [Vibrio phage Gary]|uniref:Uncharacterized protein n=1 Tax=Vibrio phage Gary TaxID=2801534 RepID=A0A7U0G888_9CAUD|nr:hypothetical protein KNV71_gp149 [Vibrio phage Gary]QQV88251.1 hypothetical protein GARY_170 [Vibrio phage Gary]